MSAPPRQHSMASSILAITIIIAVLVSAAVAAPFYAGASPTRDSAASFPSTPYSGTPNGVGRAENSSGPGTTIETLVLGNNTTIAGNYLGGFNGIVASSVAIDPQDHRLFVANQGTGNSSYTDEVIVVNASDLSVIGGIPVGDQPDAVFFDAATDQVFVANQNSDNVTVIDASTDRVVYSVPVGLNPDALALDPASHFLFVANENSANLSVINTTSGRLWGSAAAAVEPDSLLFDPTTGFVYSLGLLDSRIGRTNGTDPNSSGPGASIGVGGSGMTLDPATDQIWIADPDGGNVTLYDPVNNTVVGQLKETYDPVAVDYDPGNGYVYAANDYDPNSGNLTVLNSSNLNPAGVVAVGDQPTDIAIDAPNDTIYVTNGPVGTISIISTNSSLKYLISAAVSPRYSDLEAGTSESIIASSMCNAGPCPANVTFSWSLSNSLGRLNSTSGNDVTFTAGSSIGNTTLTVDVSLDGVTVQAGARINITSPLVGVSVEPTAISLPTGTSADVNASASCGALGCPINTTYSWSVPGALGKLNATTGSAVSFTAGATVGTTVLTVTASLFGATATASTSIEVTASRFASNLSQSAASGPAPLTVWFNASASGGPGPFAFAWTFGDGASGTGPSVSHTYATTGVYSVILIAYDAINDSTHLTASVQVYPTSSGGPGEGNSNWAGPLYVSISGSPVTGPAPLTTELTATATGGIAPYSFEWNFGDGSQNQSGAQLSHTYASLGEYAATVFVADQAGDQVETGVFVDVGNASSTLTSLAAYVTVLAFEGTAPFTTQFSPAAIGGTGDYSLTWDFGDGSGNVTMSGLAPVSHTYTSTGRFFPQLTVTDSANASVHWSAAVLGHAISVSATGSSGGPSSAALSGLAWTWVAGLVVAALVAGAVVGAVARSRRDETATATPVRPGYEAYRAPIGPPASPPRPPLSKMGEVGSDDPESDML